MDTYHLIDFYVCEVIIRGPAMQSGLPGDCWVLSAPLGKEVQPEGAESGLEQGKLSIVHRHSHGLFF